MKKPAKQHSPKLVGHLGRFALSAVVLVSIAYVFVGLFSVHRVFEPSQSYGRDHHGTPQDFTHQVVSSALLSEFE